ncbi:N-acyl-phosphatidylethanolamine-hydrolyzing phospholipase D [Agrocybe pediades]|nr:N-acyl-phosphatidylethanolamine-hydrolyzing phospholipase D [Agrocybe pediades]
MADSTKYSLKISSNASKDPEPVPAGTKPHHWANPAGSLFVNPWKSFRPHTMMEKIGLIRAAASTFPSPPKNVAELMPIHTPTWGKAAASSGSSEDASAAAGETKADEEIKATWLGHACFLVELPSRMGGTHRGVRVLFDPVFSDRCSPSQYMGPKRFTPPPCKIEDIPEVDAVVISHNHYDHLDTHTIRTLLKRTSRTPHFFAPLGNASWFESMGVPTSHTHTLDWWESKRLVIAVEDSSDEKKKSTVDITCTPGQHFTGRSLTDNFKTLWAGWVVEEVTETSTETGARPPTKIYFGGDTGYRAVMDGENEDEVPVCPAFESIGKVFGGFDLALIPIGAYLPRQFMSPIHCAPQDSVRLFKDLKARKALGMHWGTWILTAEDVTEPPRRLAEECKKIGIPDGDFTVCEIGETRHF